MICFWALVGSALLLSGGIWRRRENQEYHWIIRVTVIFLLHFNDNDYCMDIGMKCQFPNCFWIQIIGIFQLDILIRKIAWYLSLKFNYGEHCIYLNFSCFLEILFIICFLIKMNSSGSTGTCKSLGVGHNGSYLWNNGSQRISILIPSFPERDISEHKLSDFKHVTLDKATEYVPILSHIF